VENMNGLLRQFFPKGTDFTEKGLGGKPRDLSLGWIAQPPEGWGANAEG